MSQRPGPPRFVTLPEIRRAARERLPREAWNFGDGGAETETTLRRNRRHLDRLAIEQNVLVDVREIDLRTSLLGVPLSWPVSGAPLGGLVRARFSPRKAREIAPTRRGPNPESQARLTWADVEWLMNTTKLPVGLKGIMTVRDARRAVDMGVRLIWVSNHGGRQLDHTQSTIEALPPIVDAVAGRAEIVVDGGFSRGTDVVKALARGAKMVAIGRTVLWGLAADGAAGVARAFEILREEVRTTMGLCGRTRIADLTPDLIFRVD